MHIEKVRTVFICIWKILLQYALDHWYKSTILALTEATSKWLEMFERVIQRKKKHLDSMRTVKITNISYQRYMIQTEKYHLIVLNLQDKIQGKNSGALTDMDFRQWVGITIMHLLRQSCVPLWPTTTEDKDQQKKKITLFAWWFFLLPCWIWKLFRLVDGLWEKIFNFFLAVTELFYIRLETHLCDKKCGRDEGE